MCFFLVCCFSASIAIAPEIEVKMQHALIKHTLIASLMGHIPFLLHNLERNIFVWGSSHEANDAMIVRVLHVLCAVARRLGGVDEIRIEDVELVALHSLKNGRWVGVVVREGGVVMLLWQGSLPLSPSLPVCV